MKNFLQLAILVMSTFGAIAQTQPLKLNAPLAHDLSVVQPALKQLLQQFEQSFPSPAVQNEVAALVQITQQLQRNSDPKKVAAEAVALASGMPLRTTLPDGRVAEIARLSPTGRPMYYITSNLNAAATTSVDKVWPGGSAGLSLAGSGMLLGEWDGGAVRLTHQEFPGGVVTQVDGSTTISDHATHVAGTMVARGTQANAKGMAYQATLAAYDWTNDQAEMMAAAGSGMLVSNHSYGLVTGFDWGNWSGTTGWHWMSEPGDTEDRNFGRYSDEAQEWDAIANNRPNYLIVKAAGNDRGDGPTPGSSYFHQIWNGSAWVWQATTMARQLDGGPTGYDCIGHAAMAKNVLTVGAVNGIAGGYTSAGQVVMSSFSGWGPTDDGRIKPDIVGKGVGVYSPITGTNNSSYDTYNGTSMASPNVSGGLILLQQHYKNLNSNQVMSASTLKALVLHTADEAGANPGPDYVHGWGLMNVKKATDVIGNVGGKHAMVATTLSNSQTYTYQVNSNGTEPLRATMVWNDPAGVAAPYVLNGNTPALVRDLDVRIIRNGDNAIFSPWILNPANRTAAATTGDNVRDNVEQVLLANPVAGSYTVRVTHKGNLATPQAFSLIVSGVSTSTTAQLTFRVDMTGQTVSPNGVHIMGSFQGFNPATTPMLQQVNTQIYTYTATFTIGDTISYRFVNGNVIGNAEVVPQACRLGASVDRFIIVPGQVTALPAFLYGSCTANGLLFEENFANGIGAGWTQTGSAAGVANVNARFEYRGPATTPNNTIGSRGAYNSTAGSINSPSSGNGFVIFDSDWRDNNGVAGAFGTGTAPSPHIVALMSPAINTSSITNLTLQFNQFYRRFAGPGGVDQTTPATYLVFSTDNGTSWPDTVMLNQQVPVNNSTADNSVIRFNVGQYIGNAAAARIQFLFNGDYYFWMLDDISLEETAAHDLVMLSPTATKINTTEYYGHIPLSQVDTMEFKALALNSGAAAQANVGLRAQVFRNGQSGWTEFNSNGPGLLNPGDTTPVRVNQPPYLPNQLGSYRVALELTNFVTDSEPMNNRDTINFNVTSSEFALDDGGFASSALGTNSFTGATDGIFLANRYRLNQAAEINSGFVRFTANSVAGGFIQLHLIAEANLGALLPTLSSSIHTVTSADITNGLSLAFTGTPSVRTVAPGVYYLAAEMYSNSGANHFRILDQLTVPTDPLASIIYLPSPNPNWYNNGNAFVLRLDLSQPVTNCSSPLSAPGMNANNQVVVCSGTSITLTAPQDAAATFQWYRDGNPINWSTNHELQVFVGGSFHHTKTVGTCIVNSDTVQVNVTNAPVSTIGTAGSRFYSAGSTINTLLSAGGQASLRIGTQLSGGGQQLPYFRADSVDGWFAQVPAAVFSGDMVVVRDGTPGDSLGCNALVNAAQVNGKIAVIYRGACEFGAKALNAQQAGAIAVILINNAENAIPPLMGSGAVGAQVTIPVVSVSLESGQLIRQLLQLGITSVAFGQAPNGSFTYQWYRDNFPINGATQATYQATTQGAYTLIMNPGSTCSSVSQPLVIRQSIFQQTPWQLQNLNQPAVNLTVSAVHAVDSQVIWSISETPTGLAFPITFFRTTDGGTTWTSGSIPGTEGLGTSSITAVNANTAWITLYGDPTRQGVYRTTNGGISWTRQSTAFNAGGFPNVTRFFDANMGVTLGDMNGGFLEIYTTTNGGQQWNRVPSSNIPNWMDTLTAGMVDEATILGSYIYYPLNNGNYMVSTNFGQSWTTRFTQVFGQMLLAAADTNTIVIYGNQAMQYTTDGGNIWFTIDKNPGVGQINAMKFIPGASVPTLIVSGNLGTSYTTDFNNWNYIDSVYHKELSFISPRHGWSGGLSTTGNLQGMYRWNSTHFLNTTPPSGQTARIFGTVRYDNSASTPLSNALVLIQRTPTMEILDSVRTNLQGQYVSAPLAAGSYQVSAQTAKVWGGGNATDALLISRHFANLSLLQGQRLSVADVNASTQVNNTDALLVSQRFIGAVPTFNAGDWQITNSSINLNSGDSVMQNLSALCFGDVNGSHTPIGNAREQSQVVLVQDGPVTLSTTQFTELFVTVQEANTIGALSLVLQLPQGVVFEDVSLVPAHQQGLSYQRNGNELRISWYSLQPLVLSAGDALLKIRFQNGSLPIGQHGIQIGSASEIADANGQLIAGATLVIPQLVGVHEANLNNLLQLLVYPNPFQSATQLQLDLPEAGNLKVEIRDLSGRTVRSLDFGRQAEGRQQLVLEREHLRSGVYFATVRLQSAENSYLRIVRLIAE